MGTLYIVATPIGNLKDITLRALETLRSADLVLAEDTRVVRKLLSHYEIRAKIVRYDEYSRTGIYEDVTARLARGEKVALVSDAGTPGIADPGSQLVDFVRAAFPAATVVPVPGASAIATALSASGLRAETFTFVGYPPHQKGRQKFFRALGDVKIRPLILYESPHRIAKTFTALGEIFGNTHPLVVGRELTKLHEEIWRGTVAEAAARFTGERARGEFVIIVP